MTARAIRHRWTAPAAAALLLAGCLAPFPDKQTTPSQSAAREGAAKQQKKTKGDSDERELTDKEKKEKERREYRKAWRRVCAAEKHAGASAEPDRQRRATIVADWITANVKNKKWRYWYLGLSKVSPDDREAMFRSEARQAGISDCPLAELLYGGPHEPAATSKPERGAFGGRDGSPAPPAQPQSQPSSAPTTP